VKNNIHSPKGLRGLELNERKIRILEYIINDYIASAEPVGSRTIARKHDMGLSSATIRNEMSDLEEMGYIVAPHASAGRVPSDKGYRLYVDRLMRRRAAEKDGNGLSEEERRFLQGVVNDNIDRIDYLMRETARAISLLTNYTAMVSETVAPEEKLHHLQLLPMDEASVVLVTVTVSKKVKNHVIRAQGAPDIDCLIRLSASLNAALGGKTAADIKRGPPKGLREAFAGQEGLLAAVCTAAADVLDAGDGHILFTSGIKNILAFPEFYDITKARDVFDALEARDSLLMLLTGSGWEDGIDVVIGQENTIMKLKDCSIIRTAYSLNGTGYGGIAVLGPTRMDYSQAVDVLHSIVDFINNAIQQ
jgi:heat-inducible transcriptional repressor